MSWTVQPPPPSQAVLAAVERLRPNRSGWREARGAVEAQAVLILRGLHVEGRAVQSVAHMQTELMLLTLTGLAEERGRRATDSIRAWFDRVRPNGLRTPPPPCGRLCLLVNQGPCNCVVPPDVATLRRRQRALIWAVETILKEGSSWNR